MIARLYAFNTLGASLGAFITTWFLTRTFGIERTIQIGALLNLLCGLAAVAFAYFHKIKVRMKTIGLNEISHKQVLEEYGKRHEATRSFLEDARTQFEFGDARLLLKLNDRKYDIIETDPIRPDGTRSGNVYSEQYFRLLKEKLKPGGFAVSWAPTPRTAYTFIKVFPYCLYFWEPGAILVGSNKPIKWDPKTIQSHVTTEFSRNHFSRAGISVSSFLKQILTEPRIITPEYDRSRIGDFNTDLFPKDEYLVPQTHEFP